MTPAEIVIPTTIMIDAVIGYLVLGGLTGIIAGVVVAVVVFILLWRVW